MNHMNYLPRLPMVEVNVYVFNSDDNEFDFDCCTGRINLNYVASILPSDEHEGYYELELLGVDGIYLVDEESADKIR
jgi:hypothetical protein